MAADAHRYKMGDIEVTVLSDWFPAGAGE